MMKKRILSLLLSVALGLSLAPAVLAEVPRVAAPAPASWVEEIMLEEEPWAEDEPAQVLADAQPDYVGAAEALRKGIAKRERAISIGDYHIPGTTAAAETLSRYIRYRYGELFALGPTSAVTKTGWVRDKNTNYLTKYIPAYTLPAEEYAAAQDFYDRELDAIVAKVPDGATDEEKVLFIHDYLAAHYEYDNRKEPNYDVYGFLRDGKGVCQAYMLVFSALMDRLGVPVSYVDSDSLFHTWNVVKLNGKWYHVDVTWDDPVVGTDILGAAGHEYFLLSDETNDALRQAWADDYKKELEKLGKVYEYKKDFVCGEDYIRDERVVTCPDKTYETGLYANADSPVIYVAGDDSWYYVCTNSVDPAKIPAGEKPGGLYRWRRGAESTERLGDYSRYIGGIAPLMEHEGSLFFSSAEVIRRYEIATGTMTTLHTQPDATNDALSGIKIENGVLSYKLRQTEAMEDLAGEILPYHDTEGGAFSYYYNFGAVGLKLPELRKGLVVLAWYDPDSGKMTRLAAAGADGAYGVSVADKDLTCAIFVLTDDGTLAPVQDKFTVHPVSTTPAQ